jgi:cytochrome c oxidase cbb3-type subunit I/II
VKLYSKKLANAHFWIGTLGIVFYAMPLYFAGFFQSLMWKQFTPDGYLVYKNFLDTVLQIQYAYWLRALVRNTLPHRCCSSWCTTCIAP